MHLCITVLGFWLMDFITTQPLGCVVLSGPARAVGRAGGWAGVSQFCAKHISGTNHSSDFLLGIHIRHMGYLCLFGFFYPCAHLSSLTDSLIMNFVRTISQQPLAVGTSNRVCRTILGHSRASSRLFSHMTFDLDTVTLNSKCVYGQNVITIKDIH